MIIEHTINSEPSHPYNEGNYSRALRVTMPSHKGWIIINGQNFSRQAAEELITVLDLMLGDDE